MNRRMAAWALAILAMFTAKAYAIETAIDADTGRLTGTAAAKTGEMIMIDADVDTAFPDALYQIKLESMKMSDEGMTNLIRECFDTHPQMELGSSTDGWTFSFNTPDELGQYPEHSRAHYLQKSGDMLTDNAAIVKCRAFAAAMGLTVGSGGIEAFLLDEEGKAFPVEQQMDTIAEKMKLVVLVRPELEGLKLPLTGIGMTTASAPKNIKDQDILLDYPCMAFVFTDEFQLLSALINVCCETARQPANEPMISAPQALQIVIDNYAPEPWHYADFTDTPENPVVVLIETSWLVSPTNVIRPGWHIAINVTLSHTKKLNTYHFGVDGLTGLCDERIYIIQ